MREKKKALKEISASFTRYYDSLSDKEVAEDRAWGEFVSAGLAHAGWPDDDAYETVSEEGLLGKSSTGVPAD
jgi:hypothetical protein